MARAFDDAQLISDGRMVTLLREADFGREADAAAAAELVAEVVTYRADRFKQLRRLPGAVFRRADGGWDERSSPTILLHLPSPVLLEPVPSPTGATLAATAECGGVSRRVRIDFGDPTSVLDGCARIGANLGLLNQLGLRSLTCDGSKVSLVWKSLKVPRELILAGARLASDLAGNGRQALYR